ncbi:hypothetical protein SETIT_3G352400v2 [Setaria italica]|uniref:Uncharacterized protein n=1 Tax=Setaria italica TaxID=4555 RepID=A0A368QMK4_SETIT|nr:hypothetical protein SETIT_3G352400v2 [Setaria italica]
MEDPPIQPTTIVEEFVLVEDASDDEEAISDVHETVEDPIFLTIEHGPIQSVVEVKEEEYRLTEDPLIQPTTIARESEELDLGIIANDGKLNDDAIQDCVDRLTELLPSDLLWQLMTLKGCAFSDFVVEISLLLR